MLKKYCKLREILQNIDQSKVQELLFSQEDNTEADTILRRVTDLNSVTLKLQSESTTLIDAGTLFYGDIAKYPSMKN